MNNIEDWFEIIEDDGTGRPYLYVIGHDSFSRELVAWMGVNLETSAYRFRGFLWDREAGSFEPGMREDAGQIEDYEPAPSDVLVMGFSDPWQKMLYAEKLISRGGRFISFIHPTAVVGEKADLGAGSIICPNAIVGRGALMEEFVFIGPGSLVGIGATIGRGCTVEGRAALGHHATLEERVYVGLAATVGAKVVIGKDAIVKAGCVVAKDVTRAATVLSAPPVTSVRKAESVEEVSNE